MEKTDEEKMVELLVGYGVFFERFFKNNGKHLIRLKAGPFKPGGLEGAVTTFVYREDGSFKKVTVK